MTLKVQAVGIPDSALARELGSNTVSPLIFHEGESRRPRR